MHNHCNDLSILCTTSTLVSLYHVLVYNQFDSGLYISQQESYNETRYKVKNILFNLVHQLFNLLYRLFTLILLTLLFQPCVTYIGFSASHYLHWLHPHHLHIGFSINIGRKRKWSSMVELSC